MATIYLDMDGVCVDFIGGVANLFKVEQEKLEAMLRDGKLIHEALLVSQNEFWERVDMQLTFWRNLQPYRGFLGFVEKCRKFGDVCFLTSPCWDAKSLTQKVEWLQGHFGKDFRDYVVTNQKWRLAQHGVVLIDDTQHQCAEFKRHKGFAILFPRPWNSAPREGRADPFLYTLHALRRWQDMGKLVDTADASG